MKQYIMLIPAVLMASGVPAQTNITINNPEAVQVLLGNYDPAQYTPPVIINDPDSILAGIVNRVSRDTMVSWLQHLDSYYNRNTGSDTVSNIRGIGAARRWIFQKFNEFRALSGNRLVVSYNDFDVSICGQTHHRNVLAILPGLDTTQKEIMLLEGHFDTRCSILCDTSCYTPGMEDNGSGTVLVMELARIMMRYAYAHTIVFACLTGEDEGLFGAKALSTWMKNNNVPIRAVLNNDIIGGFICGMTSSPPGCPYFNHIDSTHVRIFSFSQANDSARISPHKQLARYIRMHQEETINPLLETPMTINIIISEDRTGRSGDHIPFRQKGYTAIRFTSQNEHGNGQGIPPDRQHTSDDILGLDLTIPPDGIIDSFFVDPHYLRRNTLMNGVNLGWLAIAPPSPDPEFIPTGSGLEIILHGTDSLHQHYRVGLRTKGSGSLYFDTIYTFTGTNHLTIENLDPSKTYYFSVSNVSNGVASLFCDEYSLFPVNIEGYLEKEWGIILNQNAPNPFMTSTAIEILADQRVQPTDALLIVSDLTGRIMETIPLNLSPGLNKVDYSPGNGIHGMLTYSLAMKGTVVCTKKMSVL
jgi:hypothetical protein